MMYIAVTLEESCPWNRRICSAPPVLIDEFEQSRQSLNASQQTRQAPEAMLSVLFIQSVGFCSNGSGVSLSFPHNRPAAQKIFNIRWIQPCQRGVRAVLFAVLRKPADCRASSSAHLECPIWERGHIGDIRLAGEF